MELTIEVAEAEMVPTFQAADAEMVPTFQAAEAEMALTAELPTFEQELKRCYHCGHVSADSPFKYYDNKKLDQPRFQCCNCHKLFTWGSHGRAQGKTYQKKKNEDPEELRGLHRQCRHCGVADNAPFKYYNNNSMVQPRFQCLSCRKQFQMRLMGEGHERHLVHTGGSTKQRRQKRGLATTPSCNTLSTDGTMNSLCDGMLVPIDPYTTRGAMPHDTSGAMPYEDVELKNLIAAGSSQDTNEVLLPVHNVDMVSNNSTNANVDYVLEMTESARPMDRAIMEGVFECDQSGPPLCGEDYYPWDNSTNANVDYVPEMTECAPPMDQPIMEGVFECDQSGPPLCREDYYSHWDDTMGFVRASYLEGCNISSNISGPHVPLAQNFNWSSVGF